MLKYIKELYKRYKNYRRMKGYIRELKDERNFRFYTFTIEDAIKERKLKEQKNK